MPHLPRALGSLVLLAGLAVFLVAQEDGCGSDENGGNGGGYSEEDAEYKLAVMDKTYVATSVRNAGKAPHSLMLSSAANPAPVRGRRILIGYATCATSARKQGFRSSGKAGERGCQGIK